MALSVTMTAQDLVLHGCFHVSLSSTDVQEPEPDDPSMEPEEPSIQSFCLEEEEELPTVTSSSPAKTDQSESSESGAAQEESKSEPKNLIELETAEESHNKTHEVRTHTHYQFLTKKSHKEYYFHYY